MRRLLPILSLALAACSTPGELPEGTGEGLVRWDRTAPDGAETFDAPRWTVGDRFVYESGDWLEMTFRVVEVSDEQLVLEEEESGLLQILDPDLGVLGQELPGNEDATRRNAPADTMFSFPLWAGKRWAVEFLSKRPGYDAMPFVVEYHCDAIETLSLPAGDLRCLRIWRRARPVGDGEYKERTTLYWYSPEVGFIARRLDDGVLLSMREAHRQ